MTLDWLNIVNMVLLVILMRALFRSHRGQQVFFRNLWETEIRRDQWLDRRLGEFERSPAAPQLLLQERDEWKGIAERRQAAADSVERDAQEMLSALKDALEELPVTTFEEMLAQVRRLVAFAKSAAPPR